MGNIKDLSIVIAIVLSIAGSAIGYGKMTQDVNNTNVMIGEIKQELLEKRKVDMEQSIILREVTLELKNLYEIYRRGRKT